MKKRKAKSNSESEYDTFSITMELERPLLYNDENNSDKNNKLKKENKSQIRKKEL